MAAMHRVLNTPELLESILRHADQQTLLTVAQRVCKVWHQQITQSPALAKYLFLRIPIPEAASAEGRAHYVLNPLLVKAFPFFFSKFETRKQKASQRCVRAELAFQDTELYTASQRGPPNENPFLREGSSWMDMQISDPPTTLVKEETHSSSLGCKHTKLEEKTFPHGLRMADLYAYVLKRVLGYDYAGACVIWPTNKTVTHRSARGDPCQLGDQALDASVQEESTVNLQDVTRRGQTRLLLVFSYSFSCVEDDSEDDGWDPPGAELLRTRNV